MATAKKDVATNAVATTGASALLATGDAPSHVTNATGAGNENVTAADMTIPRIKLLQDLSPETKKSKAEFVEGAEPGFLFNTVTRELLTELYVVNLFYDHTYALFRDRDFGGGFEGEFASYDAAYAAAVEKTGSADQALVMFNITETGRHTVAIVDPETGALFPAVIDMSSTKLRVSSAWNTDLNRLGGDRFSSIWKLGVVEQSNKKGTFYNYKLENLGWVNDAIHAAANTKYQEIRAAYAARKAPASSEKTEEAVTA